MKSFLNETKLATLAAQSLSREAKIETAILACKKLVTEAANKGLTFITINTDTSVKISHYSHLLKVENYFRLEGFSTEIQDIYLTICWA